jgi:surfactin synthase thioesterase subunit
MTMTSTWLDSVHANAAARLRLFCFAHAGGAANFFAQWWRKLPADIEVCPVQLPGRWSRWREEPLRDVVTASRLLARNLAAELAAKPCIFYGSSATGRTPFPRAPRRPSASISCETASRKSSDDTDRMIIPNDQ